MNIKEKLSAIPLRLKIWIVVLVVTTLFAGLAYGLAQQILRQDANDPQNQLSEDIANAINSGAQADQIIPNGKTDITTTLAPFAAIYDASGKALTSSGQFDKQSIAMSSGVFDYVSKHGKDSITWQPSKTFRAALVINKTNSGYVVVGRSLREVEKRETNMGLITLVGWAVTLIASLIVLTVLF